MADLNEPSSNAVEAQTKTGSLSSTARSRPTRRLSTLIRLSLGSLLLAADIVANQLRQWESEEAQVSSDRAPTKSVLAPAAEWETILKVASKKSRRYALIGFVSVSQARLRRRFRRGRKALGQASQAAGSAVAVAARPLLAGKLFAPIRHRAQTVVERAESQMGHWIEVGRAEEARSRALAESAFYQLVDKSMDQLADSPRVQIFIQEVVHTQSLGLADEVLEEIRERTVTADLILESLMHASFGRPPREALPAPEVHYLQLHHTKSERLKPKEQTFQGHYAGFIGRFLAFAIDVCLLAISLGLLAWFVAAINRLFGLWEFYGNLVGPNMWQSISTIVASLIATLFIIGYPLFFWVLTGQTPGKMLLGLRVITLDGYHVSFGRALRRLIGYALAILPLFVGFLWILFDRRWQGWHDKLAGTCVVYTWPARPDETFLRDKI